MKLEDILDALKLNDYYILTTAKYLNITRSTLYGYIKKYNITLPKRKGPTKKFKIQDKKITNIYYKMMSRCYNKNSVDYKYYGFRGITVCEEWRNNRDTFAEFIMNLENFNYDGYSLDRIDNNSNYEPSNVRFSTCKEQCNNRRSNRIIIFNGIEMTVTEFCENYAKHLTVSYILDRLNLGFTSEQILEVPKNSKRKYFYR